MVAEIFATGLRSYFIDPTLLFFGEKLAGQIGLGHFQPERRIVIRILPGLFVRKKSRTFFVFDKDIVVLVLGFVFVVKALEKVFGIANRTNNKIAVAHLATAGGIFGLTIAFVETGVVRHFAS